MFFPLCINLPPDLKAASYLCEAFSAGSTISMLFDA